MLADFGYGWEQVVPDINSDDEMSSTLVPRHATVNKPLKCFNILRCLFRHDLSLHLLFPSSCQFCPADSRIFESSFLGIESLIK